MATQLNLNFPFSYLTLHNTMHHWTPEVYLPNGV